MSQLLDKYNNSVADGVVKARVQSEGQSGVNYFDRVSDFQTQFTPRTPGDKTVVQSNDADDTLGTYTDRALLYYGEQVNTLAGMWHKYNQRNRDSHYIEQNRETLGVARQSSIV